MGIFFELFLVIFLVLLNGFFVASEFALVSVRRTRIDELVKKGRRRARLVQGALNDLESYISSTQLGITVASLGLGWIGEPAIANLLEPFFHFLPRNFALIGAHSLAVIIAFTLITFLHIVLGELAPKTIALQSAEKTAVIIITPLVLFTKIFSPFILLLNGAGSLVLKLLGYRPPSAHQLVHSEEEIKLILAQSQEEGVIEKEETTMLYNVFKLSDLTVKQIMIPRTEIVAFELHTPVSKVINTIKKYPYFSRFPVYKGTIDSIVGFIHIKDIYKVHEHSRNATLDHTKIIRKILSVPEIKKVDEVFIEMRKKRIHIAVIKDEFGGTAGIVSMEDIIESVLGDIEDEFDSPALNIKKLKDGSYLVDGTTSIDVIRNKFKLSIKGQGYTTIGGLIFGLIGREPEVGEKVVLGDLVFTVEKVENKRIKSLKISKRTNGKQK